MREAAPALPFFVVEKAGESDERWDGRLEEDRAELGGQAYGLC